MSLVRSQERALPEAVLQKSRESTRAERCLSGSQVGWRKSPFPALPARGLPGRRPGNLHKKLGWRGVKFVQYFFVKGVDFFGVIWYNISVSERETNHGAVMGHSPQVAKGRRTEVAS